MLTALAYMRVSGQGQADGDGFDRQRIAIERYAAANDIQISGWYQDIQTGKDEWEKRPGWTAMMGRLNGTRTVLVEKLDRVARAVLVQELILADLARREVRIVTSAGDDTSDDSPERTMFRQLLASFAQYERHTTVLKLRGARQRMKEETGRCEGRKPYGHRDGELAVLDRIKSLSAFGAPVISEILNAEGVPTRYGKPWRATTIRRILAVRDTVVA
jgi:DNA invertase Pin-like site-specific DNA recombinase